MSLKTLINKWPKNSFFLVFILGVVSHPVQALEHYRSGPISDSEYQILSKDLTNLQELALTPQNCNTALASLERLTYRYPGQNLHSLATFTLGACLVNMDLNKDALPHLKSAVTVFDKSIEGVTARLWLAHAYLRLNLPQEALLVAEELLSRFKMFPDRRVSYAALTIKARALQLKKLYSRAEQTLRAATVSSPVPQGSPIPDAPQKLSAALTVPVQLSWLDGFYHFIQLEQELQACRSFKVAKADEAQSLDRFERLGLCINQAMLWIQKSFESSSANPHWGEHQLQSLNQLLLVERQIAKNPAQPLVKFKSPREKNQFLGELSEHLSKNLTSTVAERKSKVSSWKTTPSMAAAHQKLLGLL